MKFHTNHYIGNLTYSCTGTDRRTWRS